MNTKIRILIGAAVGALLGYAYFFFVGCKSGTCPITSNWINTTLYGLVSGIIIAFPAKKKNENQQMKNEDK